MVCRECGETWPSRERRPLGRARKGRRPAPAPLIVAEKQPLVSYTNLADTAWKAKIEGDYWPEPPRQRRLPMIAAAVASALFLAGFFGARDAAVTALPDLAGLYRAIGLPVNLNRIAIEDVKAKGSAASANVSVSATLRNLGSNSRPLPPLVAEWRAGNASLGGFVLALPETSLAGGKVLAMSADIGAMPKGAESVALRFLRPGESLPAGGTAKPVGG
jgi:hypothetical protein